MQMIRGVEVLELIGSPDAREHLEGLAKGVEGALLTNQAREALIRLTADLPDALNKRP